MTTTQIEKRQAKANIPYELAKQIRKLLDDARKAYGAEDWEANDVESQVFDLVSGE